MLRKLITPIFLRRGQAVRSLSDPAVFPQDEAAACAENPSDKGAVSLAEHYSNTGADILLIFDQSDSDEEHDASLNLMRQMARVSDVPLWGAGNVRRAEDVKKILYAGCRKAVLNYARPSNLEMLEEVSKRFGREKIAVCIDTGAGEDPSKEELARIGRFAQDLILLAADPGEGFAAAGVIARKQASDARSALNVILASGDLKDPSSLKTLASTMIEGIGGAFSQETGADLMGQKASMKEAGMEVNLFESAYAWDELKCTQDGLIPVVVQDYQNEEVLMVAYMNREAYEATIRTGVMTYWSRSRRELWVKGMTSGHYQYLKELRIDCDNDTLLARVAQVGAACHTGNRSCFYRTALKKDAPCRNPMKVFEDVFATIEDRRLNPREGSYTNYLFEKGIDKILKKCGEEAAEIIIAAKNPNPEEVKYEMADFLYHMMVLMSERGVTWDDIAQELANRE